ncbi:hypothetical protein JXA05_00670 [Candidatus Peregrinibacteria bacterium]|nr:hypothetical protein [Candidatus Peregrinibacteria bacterium]
MAKEYGEKLRLKVVREDPEGARLSNGGLIPRESIDRFFGGSNPNVSNRSMMTYPEVVVTLAKNTKEKIYDLVGFVPLDR